MEGVEIGNEIRVWVGQLYVDADMRELLGGCPYCPIVIMDAFEMDDLDNRIGTVGRGVGGDSIVRRRGKAKMSNFAFDFHLSSAIFCRMFDDPQLLLGKIYFSEKNL